MGSDFWLVVRFWSILFLIGAVTYPIAKRLFTEWWDRGYAFSKALGLGIVTYLIYSLGTLHLLPFTVTSAVIILVIIGILGVALQLHVRRDHGKLRIHFRSESLKLNKRDLLMILAEEMFFFGCLLFWSWIKGHEASIRSLEKFMDYGFTRTILNTRYFPVPDMWYAGFPVNYYYFGHIVMALLTKLSGIDLAYTFNIMLAAIFAQTATMSYSIGYELVSRSSFINTSESKGDKEVRGDWEKHQLLPVAAGVLISFLVTLAGNMQTVYAFTRGYTGDPPPEGPIPFWKLAWPLAEFWSKLPEGLERYWYANATRFIPFTIHEFPSYSFTVSDLHGHVLAIPFALLSIALLIDIFSRFKQRSLGKFYILTALFGGLAGLLLMTNALDGPIYIMLFLILLGIAAFRTYINGGRVMPFLIAAGILIVSWVVVSSPFLFHFKSFVSGLAVNCPPTGLANTKIGPFIFEEVTKCQHSALWMWWLLWGFFIFCGGSLIIYRFMIHDLRFMNITGRFRGIISELQTHEVVLMVFFTYSILLVIFPEFFYFKDIYPAHFRSNTMFKLGYQAFIMFSIVAGYSIVYILSGIRGTTTDKVQSPKFKVQIKPKVQSSNTIPQPRKSKLIKIIFLVLLVPQLFLVSIFSIFSVRSYFGGLIRYQGLYGLNWLITEFPDDFKATEWLTQNGIQRANMQAAVVADRDCTGKTVYGSTFSLPVIVEADGDSYTDYNHFSAFSGLPTVVGWAVHEWLWRGCYDVVAPRREEVRTIYESPYPDQVKELLRKYSVRYIIIGKLEREKYINLNTEGIEALGRTVYRSGDTTITEVNL